MIDEEKKSKKNSGYISLHRSILNSSIFGDAILFQMYITCIMRASFKDKTIVINSQIVKLNRGEFVVSMEKFGAIFGLNRQTTIRKISALKSANKIDTKGYNKFTLIKVNNYDFWQGERTTNDTINKTSNGHQTVQQTDTNNNYNNFNKENKDFFVFDFLSELQKKSFEKKPEFLKRKVFDKNFKNRILAEYYFFESFNFESEILLNVQLKNDREVFADSLEIINSVKQTEYLQIMANLKKNQRLSLANTASAIKAKQAKTSENINKKQNITKELSKRFAMPF